MGFVLVVFGVAFLAGLISYVAIDLRDDYGPGRRARISVRAMEREALRALTAEDRTWLKAMGWEPQSDGFFQPGLVSPVFLPTISTIGAPTAAELRA